MLKLFSSRNIIKVLENNHFIFISQKGSHLKFRKNDKTVIVPSNKKEIPLGTFRSILRQSGLDQNNFQ